MSQGPVVVVGLGGLGAPIAMVLAKSSLPAIRLVDGDTVERSNLHRQVLFSEADVHASKAHVVARAMRDLGYAGKIEVVEAFFVPERALEFAQDASMLVEGVDNLPTKFLVADVAARLDVPVVHSAALRWEGTVLAKPARGACYRCLFEDIPHGADAPNCAGEGVAGPLVGLVGAWAADRVLALRDGALDDTELSRFDGWAASVRQTRVARRPGCSLCRDAGSAFPIDRSRYAAPSTYCVR